MSTKDRIVDSLEQLLESETIDNLRTRQIIEKSGISKQTFYYHFRDKFEVLEASYMRMFGETLGRISKYYPFSEACEDLYDLFEEKRAMLKNACSSADPNGLLNIMQRTLYRTYREYLEKRGLRMDDRILFALKVFTIGGCETTVRWIESGMEKPSKKELVALYKASLPACIAPYFI